MSDTAPSPTDTSPGGVQHEDVLIILPVRNLVLYPGVIAPLGDELFFRGFATTAWARAAGTRSAIIRGALFFSFAHILTLLATSFGSGAASALVEFVG